MDNAMVLTNLEAPKQKAAGYANTGKTAKSEKAPTQDFKQMFENCTITDAPKQLNPQFVQLFVSGIEQTDNSMPDNYPTRNDLGEVVGTLEGFELLDYQSDNKISVSTEELLGFISKGNTQNSAEESSGFPVELMNGFIKRNEQKNQMSEQLAGMRPNEQLKTQNITQQEILQRVGTYLCSLESTNNDSVSSGIANAEEITSEGSVKISSTLKKDARVLNDGSEANNNGAQLKPDIAVTNNRTFSVESAQTSETVQAGQETNFASDNILNIVDKVRTSAAEGKHDFDIQLKPEFLGKVNIKLTMESGNIKVQIKTDDSAVKGLVSENLVSLQNMLEDKGVNVSNIDVYYDSQTFAGNDQQAFNQNTGYQQMQKKNINMDTIDSMVYDVMTELPDVYLENSSVEFRA